ncbi:hypothetical protein PVA45_02680 [Entomospira entomophila]|uniref:Mannose-6-phosphate isomerase n=1 Tax=Entomospira entomophila TaxID=2719988 RepID=A0A968GCH6_9SPIO|nr:hypothetical protein [Entomospira entomophilus]NIZ40419.1 hypothetical protein [Entomospira entomophilus]WDI35977.1 hypothetical protein PVA45_02680 [Entomospira entomophilus]
MLKYPHLLEPHLRAASWGDQEMLNTFFPTPATKDNPIAEISYTSHPHDTASLLHKKESVPLYQFLRRQEGLILDKKVIESPINHITTIFSAKCAQPLRYAPPSTQSEEIDNAQRHEKHTIIYALEEPLHLLAGLQDPVQILENLELLSLSSIKKIIQPLKSHPPSETAVYQLLQTLFSYDSKQQEALIMQLLDIAEQYEEFNPMYQTILAMHQANSSLKMQLFLPLFMKNFHMHQAEMLYIPPAVPLQIIHGMGLEIANTTFNIKELDAKSSGSQSQTFWEELLQYPVRHPQEIHYDIHNPNIPMAKLAFRIQLINLENTFFINGKNNTIISIVLKGKMRLSSAKGNPYHRQLPIDDLVLRKGEAFFLPMEAGGYYLEGRGICLLVESQI